MMTGATSVPSATVSLFTTQTPVAGDAADGTDSYSLGTYFTPSVPGTVTAIRWFFPTTGQPGGQAVKAALFRTGDSAKISADLTFATPGAPGAWNEVAVSVPVLAGVQLAAVIWTPLRYVASSGAQSPWPLTNGPLSAPAAAGRYTSGLSGVPEFPTGSSNNSCYFVDVVFLPA